jgi:spermidine synthase
MLERSKVPEGKAGRYEVRKFTVSKKQAKTFNFHMLISYKPSRMIHAGDYTKLVEINNAEKDEGILWMSDTPAELRDHYEAVSRARGTCLVNGLGLGVVVIAMLKKPEVTRLIVNEISPEVIALVLKHLPRDERLSVNCADAYTWHPNGTRFDTIWHDIWPSKNDEGYEESKKLMRRYGHWLKPGAWQGSWCKWDRDRYWQ